jgi:hypothetical protein
MRKRYQLIKCLLAGAASILVIGCTVRPNLVSAKAKKEDEMQIIEVVLSANDAKKIREREIYFSIVVVDCNNLEKRFPISPFIAGKPISKFNFPVVGQFVTAQGEAPNRILADFPKACVILQGGSYFFSKIESTVVPLE